MLLFYGYFLLVIELFIIQLHSTLSVNHINHLKLSYSVFRVRLLRLSQCHTEMK